MTATEPESAYEAIPDDPLTGTPTNEVSELSAKTRIETSETLELAHRLIDVLADRQAENIVLLDLTVLYAFTDYFVIATGTSDRQLQTLVDTVMRSVPGLGRTEQEGDAAGGWVLLDCDGVVVHLFSVERRAYYNLEGLWSRAQEVVRIQ